MVSSKKVIFFRNFQKLKISLLEHFIRVAEAYEVLRSAQTRAIFDQFGEEGLKNGLPKQNGGWSEGYTFHGDAKRVFREFFGTDNPFADFQVKLFFGSCVKTRLNSYRTNRPKSEQLKFL